MRGMTYQGSRWFLIGSVKQILETFVLGLSISRPLTLSNQWTSFYMISMEWFLHDRDFRHERIK